MTAAPFAFDGRCSLVVGDRVWVGERDGSITIRNVDGATIHVIEGKKGAYVWCMTEVDGSVWAGCSDGFIRVLTSKFTLERQFAKHAGGGGGVRTIAFHGPSNLVFSGSNDFEILAWNASTTDFHRQLSLSSGVRCLLVDQHTLLAGTDDGIISSFDILRLEKTQQWTGHSRSVLALCKTASHIWSGSEDGTIRIWNPTNGDVLGVAEVHVGAVSVLKAVGSKVWCGAGDSVSIWDAEKLSLLGTYVAHEGYVDTLTVVARTSQYKIWSSATDKTQNVWHSECIPDQTRIMEANIERLQRLDFEHQTTEQELRAQNAQLLADIQGRDAKISELSCELGDANRCLAQRDESIRVLEGRLMELEADKVDLQQRLNQAQASVLSLEGRLTVALADVQRLTASLAESEREVQRLTESNAHMALHTKALEQENAELQAQRAELSEANAGLRADLDAAQGECRKLQEQLTHALADIDGMANKLREMDIIFKSRLRLLTDMFRVYKKFEHAEKRARGADYEGQDAMLAGLEEFKVTVAKHYTDDELAHLGSSRHFFPQPSPTSPKAPAQ